VSAQDGSYYEHMYISTVGGRKQEDTESRIEGRESRVRGIGRLTPATSARPVNDKYLMLATASLERPGANARLGPTRFVEWLTREVAQS